MLPPRLLARVARKLLMGIRASLTSISWRNEFFSGASELSSVAFFLFTKSRGMRQPVDKRHFLRPTVLPLHAEPSACVGTGAPRNASSGSPAWSPMHLGALVMPPFGGCYWKRGWFKKRCLKSPGRLLMFVRIASASIVSAMAVSVASCAANTGPPTLTPITDTIAYDPSDVCQRVSTPYDLAHPFDLDALQPAPLIEHDVTFPI